MPSHVAGVIGDLMWNAGVPAEAKPVTWVVYKAELETQKTPAEPGWTLISKGQSRAWDPHLDANDFPDDIDVLLIYHR